MVGRRVGVFVLWMVRCSLRWILFVVFDGFFGLSMLGFGNLYLSCGGGCIGF